MQLSLEDAWATLQALQHPPSGAGAAPPRPRLSQRLRQQVWQLRQRMAHFFHNLQMYAQVSWRAGGGGLRLQPWATPDASSAAGVPCNTCAANLFFGGQAAGHASGIQFLTRTCTPSTRPPTHASTHSNEGSHSPTSIPRPRVQVDVIDSRFAQLRQQIAAAADFVAADAAHRAYVDSLVIQTFLDLRQLMAIVEAIFAAAARLAALVQVRWRRPEAGRAVPRRPWPHRQPVLQVCPAQC